MPRPRIQRSLFGTTPRGEPVELFTCTNTHGLVLRAMTYGATIVGLDVPDRLGRRANVALGYDTLAGYLGDASYRGALVGRYAGRIAFARFALDGRTYTLNPNEFPHHLHGGVRGFDKMIWRAEPEEGHDRVALYLSRVSPSGEEGYPGTLQVGVRYALNDANELVVEYRAGTDAATPVNLTQHTYFNLAGSGGVLGHLFRIDADQYVPLDDALIPTGELAPVAGTPFDFREPAALGSRVGPGRFDHTFVVRREGPAPAPAARVVEPASGRTLEVRTTEPGLHLYTGRPLGFTLETQHFADSPNQTRFPDCIVRPGTDYRSQTVYAFGVTG